MVAAAVFASTLSVRALDHVSLSELLLMSLDRINWFLLLLLLAFGGFHARRLENDVSNPLLVIVQSLLPCIDLCLHVHQLGVHGWLRRFVAIVHYIEGSLERLMWSHSYCLRSILIFIDFHGRELRVGKHSASTA